MTRLSGFIGRRAVQPSDRILSDLAADTGRGHILHQKLAANRERNWLLALTLHGCEKLRIGAPLSQAEEVIVDALMASGLGEAKLKDQGRLYAEMDRDVRETFFPGMFGVLKSDEAVTFKEMAEWLQPVQEGLLAKENTLILDAGAILAGPLTLSDRPVLPPSVLAGFGCGLTVAADHGRHSRPTMKCVVKATCFKCDDETGWDLAGADEPYWVFGAVDVGGKHPSTLRSRVFPDVDTGEFRRFTPGEGRIWGPGGAPMELPPTLAVVVSLWEHVGGTLEEMDAVAQGVFAATARYLSALRRAGAPIAVVAGAGSLITWLGTFLNEDYIADHTFILGRSVLEHAVKAGDGEARFRQRFSDGDGDYVLELAVTRSPWISEGTEI